MIRYAGIGTRDISSDQMNLCKKVATYLAKKDFVLHTGAATGADQMYAEAAADAGGRVLLHLPWANYEKEWVTAFTGRYKKNVKVAILSETDQKAIDSVHRFHPAPERLKPGGVLLHARNYRIVHRCAFVLALRRPGGGGTEQGVRIAKAWGVPVLSLNQYSKHKEAKNALDSLLAELKL